KTEGEGAAALVGGLAHAATPPGSTGALPPARRPGRSAITARRSASPSPGHAAISASVRPQPAQRPVSGSMVQILVQGDRAVGAMAPHAALAAPIRYAIAAICWQAPSVSPVRPPISRSAIQEKIAVAAAERRVATM